MDGNSKRNNRTNILMLSLLSTKMTPGMLSFSDSAGTYLLVTVPTSKVLQNYLTRGLWGAGRMDPRVDNSVKSTDTLCIR